MATARYAGAMRLCLTHTHDEGVGQRDRFFIGMSVGSSIGTKGGLSFGLEEEILVLDHVGRMSLL